MSFCDYTGSCDRPTGGFSLKFHLFKDESKLTTATTDSSERLGGFPQLELRANHQSKALKRELELKSGTLKEFQGEFLHLCLELFNSMLERNSNKTMFLFGDHVMKQLSALRTNPDELQFHSSPPLVLPVGLLATISSGSYKTQTNAAITLRTMTTLCYSFRGVYVEGDLSP